MGVMLVCALFFAGCDKHEPLYAYGVQLSVDGVSIDACGGERRVVVDAFLSDGDSWSVERDGAEEWFECRVEGDAIIVAIEPNNDTSMREGGFNVVSVNNSFEARRVTVTQEAAEELGMTEKNVAVNVSRIKKRVRLMGLFMFSSFGNFIIKALF